VKIKRVDKYDACSMAFRNGITVDALHSRRLRFGGELDDTICRNSKQLKYCYPSRKYLEHFRHRRSSGPMRSTRGSFLVMNDVARHASKLELAYALAKEVAHIDTFQRPLSVHTLVYLLLRTNLPEFSTYTPSPFLSLIID